MDEDTVYRCPACGAMDWREGHYVECPEVELEHLLDRGPDDPDLVGDLNAEFLDALG